MRSKHLIRGLSIAIIMAMYVASYGLARKRGWLVHRSGYAYGMVDHHEIARGDVEALSGFENLTTPLAYHFFTPMRAIETAYWNRRYPVGGSWPY